jgi:hypothetical protein
MIQTMLTTTDNPYDPFDDYDSWYNYDKQMGYHSPSYLARMVVSSNELSDLDQHLAIEMAIDEIIELNVLGIYKKVSRDVK